MLRYCHSASTREQSEHDSLSRTSNGFFITHKQRRVVHVAASCMAIGMKRHFTRSIDPVESMLAVCPNALLEAGRWLVVGSLVVVWAGWWWWWRQGGGCRTVFWCEGHGKEGPGKEGAWSLHTLIGCLVDSGSLYAR